MVSSGDRQVPFWKSPVSCLALVVGLVASMIGLVSRDWGLWFIPLYWLIPLCLLPGFFRWCASFMENRSPTVITTAAFVGGAALIGITSLSSVPDTALGDFVAEWNLFDYLFRFRLSVMILTMALAVWTLLSSFIYEITNTRRGPIRAVAATLSFTSIMQLPVFFVFTAHQTIQIIRLTIDVGGQ